MTSTFESHSDIAADVGTGERGQLGCPYFEFVNFNKVRTSLLRLIKTMEIMFEICPALTELVKQILNLI